VQPVTPPLLNLCNWLAPKHWALNQALASTCKYGGPAVLTMGTPPAQYTGKAHIAPVHAEMCVCMQEHGLTLEQWVTPTPTLWSEHKHLAANDRYQSKMEDFQELINRAKFASLSLVPTAGVAGASLAPPTSRGGTSQTVSVPNGPPQAAKAAPRSVMLVSDFPHVQNPEARDALCDQLTLLAQTVGTPCVVVVTESGVVLHKRPGVSSRS
jgi:hypothetical protein